MKFINILVFLMVSHLTLNCLNDLAGGESDSCKDAKNIAILCRLEATRINNECLANSETPQLASLECSPQRVGYEALCTSIEENACD
ncbi:hypothetical protein [Leptospira sp. GIMC2001]|uniref:hypothetical protein n=1 Tax=Leptospira sp. GIMC2001 TaxID=1513297 RepID=UPI00234B6B0D|nr:hypothetical protein [Leptospira sp. GIMC2001]WCL50342.1 hypothetical protein O4O04_05865 [Leptospira sp. GIMC2001]